MGLRPEKQGQDWTVCDREGSSGHLRVTVACARTGSCPHQQSLSTDTGYKEAEGRGSGGFRVTVGRLLSRGQYEVRCGDGIPGKKNSKCKGPEASRQNGEMNQAPGRTPGTEC